MNVLNFMPMMVMGWEWIIIVLILLLLFGGKKIPELMRGIGKGISNFKKGMKEDDNKNVKE